jgi:hypothetical protein
VAGNTDFLALFQELGLSSDCRLDEFKLAYRRRISQLHPDRVHTVPDDSESRMQRLTAMYDAALEFHRQHGRLPGFAVRSRPAGTSDHPTPARPLPLPQHPPKSSSHTRTVLIVLGLLVVLGWAMNEAPLPLEGQIPADEPEATPPAVSHVSDTAPMLHRLALGMTAREVRILVGEPMSESVDHWEYGPSWISFNKCKTVSDWYSSPLRPLAATEAHPPRTMPPAGTTVATCLSAAERSTDPSAH